MAAGDRWLERHRFSYEGSTTLLARHLIEDHGVPESALAQWSGGLTQGDWIALDNVHHSAHTEMRETNTMSRPTADEIYTKAKGALMDAEREASRAAVSATVTQHLDVARGWLELAESLADRERPRPGMRGGVVPSPNRPVTP